MKYSRFITSFCDTDKCKLFRYEQTYKLDINKSKSIPSGKIYFCDNKPIVAKICKLKDSHE